MPYRKISYRKEHYFEGLSFSILHTGGCQGLCQVIKIADRTFQCYTCRATTVAWPGGELNDLERLKAVVFGVGKELNYTDCKRVLFAYETLLEFVSEADKVIEALYTGITSEMRFRVRIGGSSEEAWKTLICTRELHNALKLVEARQIHENEERRNNDKTVSN